MTTAVVVLGEAEVEVDPVGVDPVASVTRDTRQFELTDSRRPTQVGSGAYKSARVGSLKPGRKTMSITFRTGGADDLRVVPALLRVEERTAPTTVALLEEREERGRI